LKLPFVIFSGCGILVFNLLLLCVLIVLVGKLIGERRISSDSGSLGEKISTIVGQGEDVSLSLENGATLQILEGGVEPGSSVSLSYDTSSDQLPDSDGIITGPVYEIDAADWKYGMKAHISLPIDNAELTQEQIENVQVAYLKDGVWVRLPSSVDFENRLVSADLSHFTKITWFARLFGNAAPVISIVPNHSVYTNVRYASESGEDMGDKTGICAPRKGRWDSKLGTYMPGEDLDPLQVEITLIDEEGKLRAAKVGLACIGKTDWGFNIPNNLRNDFNNHFKDEMNAGLFDADYTAPHTGLIVENFRPDDVTIPWCLDLQLLDTPNNGNNVIYNISQSISFWYPDKLASVRVYVYAWDDMDDPGEAYVDIHLTSSTLRPPTLIAPKGSSYLYCSPKPTFRWSVDSSTKSYGLFYEKGTRHDLETGKPKMRRGKNDDDFYLTSWKPKTSLKDGNVYSWAVVASTDEDDTKFNDNSKVSKSQVFQFTVDKSLEEGTCEWRSPSQSTPTRTPTSTPTSTQTVTWMPTNTPTTTSTPTSTQTVTWMPTNTPTTTYTPTPSVCPYTIPNLFGMEPSDAQELLKSLGYSYNWEKGYYRDDMAGLVVRQTPPEGTCKSPNEAIIIFYINVPSPTPTPSGVCGWENEIKGFWKRDAPINPWDINSLEFLINHKLIGRIETMYTLQEGDFKCREDGLLKVVFNQGWENIIAEVQLLGDHLTLNIIKFGDYPPGEWNFSRVR